MRLRHCVTSMALVSLAGVAAAEGIQVDAAGGYWFGAETRLRLQATPITMRQPLRLGYGNNTWATAQPTVAAALTGDYYFSSVLLDDLPVRSGFRASSALLIRQPGVSLSDVAMGSRSAASFGGSARLGLAMPSVALGDAPSYSVSTVPYVGIGYSDMSLKSGWGFWADVGVVVQSPGNVLGVSRVLSGNQGVDELMRELRMAPMVQLGVNYSF